MRLELRTYSRARYRLRHPGTARNHSKKSHRTTFRLLSECSTQSYCGAQLETTKKSLLAGLNGRPFAYRQAISKSDTFSICACHPCAGAMLIFSVSFQFYRMRRLLHRSRKLELKFGGYESNPCVLQYLHTGYAALTRKTRVQSQRGNFCKKGRNCILGRVVKELVLKANGLFPREFKSRRCRFGFFQK